MRILCARVVDEMGSAIPGKCPGCSADLNFLPGQTSVVCEYCGNRVLLSDVLKGPEGGAGVMVHTEIEKKKLAIELANKELEELNFKASRLMAEMRMLENPVPATKKGGAVMVMIMFIMMAFMVGIQLPLFYMLGIYAVYGFTRDTCLLTGIVLILIGIGGAIGTGVASKSLAAAKRDENLRSPRYQSLVWQYNQLQPQIRQAEAERERAEAQLKALL